MLSSKTVLVLATIGVIVSIELLASAAIFGDLKTSDKVIPLLMIPVSYPLVLGVWSVYWDSKNQKRDFWEVFLEKWKPTGKVH